MIKIFNVRRTTWEETKYEWGDLMRSKGLQQINREPPTGYEVAPDLITDQVEGEGFVIYPPGYDLREINHTLTSSSSIYGNRYCGSLNSF